MIGYGEQSPAKPRRFLGWLGYSLILVTLPIGALLAWYIPQVEFLATAAGLVGGWIALEHLDDLRDTKCLYATCYLMNAHVGVVLVSLIHLALKALLGV